MATKNLNLGIVPVSRGEFNLDTIYYKDNNFIVLGAYFVNVMSERPESNTDDIPVTLKIVKINDLGFGEFYKTTNRVWEKIIDFN